MAKDLVIVESPTKAKTLARFLGRDFRIESSFGHVRDLPKSKLGVDVEHDFAPAYEVPDDSKKAVTALKKAAKDAETIYFATDEDREGEAISWHLAELLQPKPEQIKRITFHEITKSAIEAALKAPRAIDLNLVNAQQARRVLDRLVGYELSPLIWKKIAYGLSAGRVQSVAVRLIVEREEERMRFMAAEYWDLLARLKKDGQPFEAKLLSINNQRVATGKDFDESTGELKKNKDLSVLGKAEAEALVKKLHGADWTVAKVEEKPITARPAPPFITSTLQQEANRKLRLSSREAMRAAQRLYEEGYITYMRTDSPSLSSEGLNGARQAIESLYGKEFLSPEPRQYSAKSKLAQEAHEAIRPAGATFVHPKDLGMDSRERAVYELIWKRTLASQMAEAKKQTMTVTLAADGTTFTASGTRILFPGFLRVYVEGSDDPEAALEDREVLLPALKEGDGVQAESLEPQQHTTKPPARFTDATLVKALEADGVGRPSTYASIIGTILDRGYVRRANGALVPTFQGFAVTQLLKQHFSHLVDVGFTSKMEEALDEIAAGTREWVPYLSEFYFSGEKFHEQVEKQEDQIDPKRARTIHLPHLKGVEVRVGRFGPYLVREGENGNGDDATHASIPEDIAPADLTTEQVEELIQTSKEGAKSIGAHPDTGESMYVLTGRFGPYVQIGETPPKPEPGEKKSKQPKPKRASIPRDVNPREVTIEQAVKWLSLPRTLGAHPDTDKDVQANNGRFGPYVVHDGNFRSIPKDEDVYTITLERGLELLAQEKRGRNGSKLLRKIGDHPKDTKPVELYEGRYGPYVKHGRTNASLPKDADVGAFTLEQAVEVLAKKKAKKS